MEGSWGEPGSELRLSKGWRLCYDRYYLELYQSHPVSSVLFSNPSSALTYSSELLLSSSSIVPAAIYTESPQTAREDKGCIMGVVIAFIWLPSNFF